MSQKVAPKCEPGEAILEEMVPRVDRIRTSARVPPIKKTTTIATPKSQKKKVPVRRDRSFRKDNELPRMGSTENNPSAHSSQQPRRDWFGELDPLGVNEQIWENLKSMATKVADEELAQLRREWLDSCQDILNGAPSCLPPLREINHRIPIIDESKVYNYHLPRCPVSIKQALSDKIERYEKAGWWKRAVATQAAPMLCVPKKNGSLRTVVDCRRRNDNTARDVTPFPDQDEIRADVARAKYRSKIDLSDAYEQIRIEPEDVHKTAFATVYGTFVSYVMQQGDCNAPSTFQRLMTYVFREYIGRFVHVYLDDIFVYSDSVEQHQEHLKLVFDKLREAQLYLKAEKCDLYSPRMECLGHIVDDKGIHADEDKMARIREWRTPRSYNDIERFLGLVNYVAHFMPDLSAYTGPLHTIQRNGHLFEWRPIHQKCFDSIKMLASQAPILKPIDPNNPDPIWVVCDASTHGVGAYYGQGKDWRTCRPAGFMSKKFTTAQRSYRVFELETIAILEALLKWEDKLLGHRVNVVTDHKALEFFKTQGRLSHRQTRWMEFLQRFDFDITYVKGEENIVADCLSRYHESDIPRELHPLHTYVNADDRLDPSGDSLSQQRIQELRSMTVPVKGLEEVVEDRELEAQALIESNPTPPHGWREDVGEDPLWGESTVTGPPITHVVDGEIDILDVAKSGYSKDKTFRKMVDSPGEYSMFQMEDGLIYTKNRMSKRVLCIPHVLVKRKFLTEWIIEQAHATVGHMGAQKTEEYIRQSFWWPRIGFEIRKYCESCGTCQTTKSSTTRPRGLLHSMPIPTRPWGSIGMDFVGPFPPSKGFDYLWVIICRLTSMVHLTPIKTTTKASELAWLFINSVVRLHGLPDTIVSDRDSKFTSHFWREVHRTIGVKLLMSTSFHPQTDGASERAIKTVGQVLRATVAADQKNWVDKLPMVEFAMNSAKSASTGFAPFELNGAMPRIAFEVDRSAVRPGVADFAQQVQDNLMMAHDAIIESRVEQTFQANKRRRGEQAADGKGDPFQKGNLVYLSTKNLNLPKKRAKKLLPKFIGPYKIVDANALTSTYELELSTELKSRGIHPRFHSSVLRPFVGNDESLFPHREPKMFYDFGMPDNTEWLVDDVVGHRWMGDDVAFMVKWNLGDSTWEPREEVMKLGAYSRYLDLLGVDKWELLPRIDGNHPREQGTEAPLQDMNKAVPKPARNDPVGLAPGELRRGSRNKKPRMRYGLDYGV